MKNIFKIARAVFLALSLSVTSYFASAAPPLAAPTAPSVLFRVDQRAPETVWRDGFVSWAAHWGTDINTDILTHIQGHYVVTQEGPHTGWVSTTQSIQFATLMIGSLASDRDAPEHVWQYEIRPTQAAYSVRWALLDYLQRHPRGSSARADIAGEVADLFQEAEWSFIGEIPTTAIYQASRFDLVPGEYRYQYRGVSELNPNYIAPPRPVPQTINPVENSVAPEVPASPVLGYEGGASGSATNDTIDLGPVSFGMSCLGVAPSSPNGKTTSDGFCYTDKEHIVNVQENTRKAYTKLVISTENGKVYCLWPTTEDGFYGVTLDTCTNAPLFLYDEYNRIYTRAYNTDWCMASEPSVVDGGATVWDYVKLEPCAINSAYQKWYISGGKIYSAKGSYPMQDWRYLMMISRNKDGYNNSLQPLRMNPDFFRGKSASQSHQVELQLGWDWKGDKYFSNFNDSNHWSTAYWNRSYYDYVSKRIFYIDLGSSSSATPTPPSKYCLTASNIGSEGWNWTSWNECYNSDSTIPETQLWSMKSGAEAYNNPNLVEWRTGTSGDGAALWVQATGQPAGRYFSATSNTAWAGNSVPFFSVRPDAIMPDKIGR